MKYSLDFSLVYATERCEAVRRILDESDERPTARQLEKLGDYILYGKDDNFLSAVDTHDILNPTRQYSDFTRQAEQPMPSTDRPAFGEEDAPSVIESITEDHLPTRYVFPRTSINRANPDHAAIPGIQELWEAIDKWQRRYDMWDGRIPPDEWALSHQPNDYRLYKLRHYIIELRSQQYLLYESTYPTLPPAPHISTTYDYDFDAPTGYWLAPADWLYRRRNPRPFDMPQPPLGRVPVDEQGRIFWRVADHTIDYENPHHIYALIRHYAALLHHSYTKLNSNTRCLCWDLERYVSMAHFSEWETIILWDTVAHRDMFIIAKDLAAYGYDLSPTQITNAMRRIIPKKIAAIAKRERVISEAKRGLIPTQQCRTCHRALPLDPLFFTRDRSRPTGFCASCKECGRKIYDLRKMQNRTATLGISTNQVSVPPERPSSDLCLVSGTDGGPN